MIEMITCFSHQRQKKLDPTNYLYHEKFRDWRRMYRRTSTFPIYGVWLPSFHSAIHTLHSYHVIFLVLSGCSLIRNVYSNIAIRPFYIHKRDHVIRRRGQQQLNHPPLDQQGVDHCANVNTHPPQVGFYRAALSAEVSFDLRYTMKRT